MSCHMHANITKSQPTAVIIFMHWVECLSSTLGFVFMQVYSRTPPLLLAMEMEPEMVMAMAMGMGIQIPMQAMEAVQAGTAMEMAMEA